VPSILHEAPLVLFRESPELAVRVLRELLGVDVASDAPVCVIEGDLTQVTPAELRADLVLQVGGDPPVLGIILEVQRAPDRRKRYVWPLYTAALHARLRCQICLVVVTASAPVARWAARPLQWHVGSRFVPLVLGPEQVPRITDPAGAARSPELAVLSALAHSADPDALEVAATALDAVAALQDERATLYYDLILGSLPANLAEALEQMMVSRKYEYRSSFAKRYFSAGREEGREEGREGLQLAVRQLVRTRLGEIPAAIEDRIATAGEIATLIGWIEALGAVSSAADVVRVFGLEP
jgi:hypothetical protein